MNRNSPSPASSRKFWPALREILIVAAGIILGQAILFGPSLVGQKYLLPLDILSGPGGYTPNPPGFNYQPHNFILSDLVVSMEPTRRFEVAELRAGRFPRWDPYEYAGTPVLAECLSPFWWIGVSFESPVVLVWEHAMVSLVAGLGAFFFFRKALELDFWPSAIVAWCYPVTALFILWQGYCVPLAVAWFPWMLLAVNRCMKSPRAVSGIGFAFVSCMALVQGQLDVAAQILFVSGLYAAWCYFTMYHKQWLARRAFAAWGVVLAGWLAGFMLAAPYVLPYLEYTHSGARLKLRAEGYEQRPPVGFASLPQVIMPAVYGCEIGNSVALLPPGETNLLESPASAFAGMLAALLVAPLAFCSRRHLFYNVFWVALVFFSLSWQLDVHPFVELFRLHFMNMMSACRLVFAAAFAILCMAATGLHVLWNGGLVRRWWWALPTLLLAGICGWCLYQSVHLPDPGASQLRRYFAAGSGDLPAITHGVQRWFAVYFRWEALFAGFGAAVWCGLCFFPGRSRAMVPLIGLFLVGELLLLDSQWCTQSDPALYYPEIPALTALAKTHPPRVMGSQCLEPRLAAMAGLWDARGYDGVDPARIVSLVLLGSDKTSFIPSYAQTEFMLPAGQHVPPDGVRLPPVLDLLGVRYIIYRGSAPDGIHPRFESPDYWALENRNALPRAFVPASIQFVENDKERLHAISSPDFNPRAVAYVETPATLPGNCKGDAEITSETPRQVDISARMETPGLVVLADSWDQGWSATLDGKPAPIIRVDHALRGVIAPAGTSAIRFVYEPRSVTTGFRIFWCGIALLCAWALVARAIRIPLTKSSG